MKRKRKYKMLSMGEILTRQMIFSVHNLRQIASQYPETAKHVRQINGILRKIMSKAIMNPVIKKRVRVEED